MTHAPHALATENRNLRAEIESRGVRIEQLWPDLVEDPRVENARLHDLLMWVEAYRANPERGALEERGFLYPPLDPGFDPETDWLQFERWMAGLPVRWSFSAEFGPLPDAHALLDEDLTGEFERVRRWLETRGVEVDLQDGLPPRIAYACLKREVEKEPFDFLAEGTRCHLTGCSGYCPGCMQRPWCAIGQEEPWPEDEEAGCLICPDEVLPFMRRALARPLPAEPAPACSSPVKKESRSCDTH